MARDKDRLQGTRRSRTCRRSSRSWPPCQTAERPGGHRARGHGDRRGARGGASPRPGRRDRRRHAAREARARDAATGSIDQEKSTPTRPRDDRRHGAGRAARAYEKQRARDGGLGRRGCERERREPQRQAPTSTAMRPRRAGRCPPVPRLECILVRNGSRVFEPRPRADRRSRRRIARKPRGRGRRLGRHRSGNRRGARRAGCLRRHRENNVAEYNGMIAGMRQAIELDPHAVLRCASTPSSWSSRCRVVGRSSTRTWPISPPRRGDLVGNAVSFEWIPRLQNSRADRLANESMDKQLSVRALGGSLEPQTGRPDGRVIRLRSRCRGTSGLHRAGRWVTPTRSNPRESATESRPPRASGRGKGETVV